LIELFDREVNKSLNLLTPAREEVGVRYVQSESKDLSS